ncbi:hypothetical protein LZ318_31875 [Saccharopolyspora indica]|uniref:hypothetical protein n=1 Tax=Saccharopolyspora indica TaxID=1229659 RepID=UPI0022EA7F9A|nr:hypothetical protein [Saccharopolyspora indica]MDA3644163.1 hypothetical protein [Saccharopolyspora indica]
MSDHLPHALQELTRVAHEARIQANAHDTRPADAARAFQEASFVGLYLMDMASWIRFRMHALLEDPEANLTDQQRRAYQETYTAFNQLAKRCIGLSTEMSRVATALDHLADAGRDNPRVRV